MQSLTLKFILTKMIKQNAKAAISCFQKILNFTPIAYESFCY